MFLSSRWKLSHPCFTWKIIESHLKTPVAIQWLHFAFSCTPYCAQLSHTVLAYWRKRILFEGLWLTLFKMIMLWNVFRTNKSQMFVKSPLVMLLPIHAGRRLTGFVRFSWKKKTTTKKLKQKTEDTAFKRLKVTSHFIAHANALEMSEFNRVKWFDWVVYFNVRIVWLYWYHTQYRL